MKIVAIIQARMGSRRLPGKVMLKLAGQEVLLHVVKSVELSTKIDQVVVATSTKKEDDIIELFCADNRVECFRGCETDVLDRYFQASIYYKADIIVRITADCPLTQSWIIDEVVEECISGGYDWYSLGGEFPDGLDCQAFTFKTLEASWRNAELEYEREHVGPYVELNSSGEFKVGTLNFLEDMGEYRLTLDETVDFKLLTRIFDELYRGKPIHLDEVITFLSRHPEIFALNSMVPRNEGFDISKSGSGG